VVKFRAFLIAAAILFPAITVYAQEMTPPQTVRIPASDSLTLVGNFYALPDDPALPDGRPAALLLHIIGGRRQDWQPLIDPLLNEGYDVLAVDLRGYGETGGDIDWTLAIADVQTWLDWLRTQPGVNPAALATVGASIGANLSLIGCAADVRCLTAVAMSPGIEYFGLNVERSVTAGLRLRSALLIVSQNDHYPSDSVKQLVSETTGEIGAQIYSGAVHGTHLFDGARRDSVIAAILDWLDAHTPGMQRSFESQSD
jgi:alpha-beta hydrolase superfamily lysophospholipase